MNLLELRTAFVQRNGRFDLVDDTTDYADNGADFFIQSGQRLLDILVPNRKSLGRYVKDVSTNQSSLFLNHVRYIDSVYIKKSATERTYLDRKTYSWLLEEYGSDFGEKAKGTVTMSAVPTADETLVIDAETFTFKAAASSSYEVTIGASVTVTLTNLVDKINATSTVITAYKTSTSTCVIEYNTVGIGGNAIVFTDTSGVITLDGAGLLGSTLAGRANGITTGTPAYYAPVISLPHPDLNLSNLGTYDTTDLIFGTSRFKQDGILFMAPADVTYTMTIYGVFFQPMTDDKDISYYSEMFPELSLMAANLSLEIFYRNTAGINDWLTSMKPWITGVDHDLVKAEMVLAGTQMRG